MNQTPPAPRLGPRPLPLHLMTAMNGWTSSRGALEMLRRGSLAWRLEVASRGAALRSSLPEAASGADPFAEAVETEIARRLAAFGAGVRAYRHHPYRRTLDDPPVIWEQGSVRLLDYGPADGAPVLFVPSLINRAYILDLSPRRSLLRWMAVNTGLRPLLVDWGAPGSRERGYHLSDYITGPLESALGTIRKAVGGPVAVAGYCMGGLLALALAARRPDDVSGLALLATPWDFHAERVAQAEALARTVDAAGPALDACGELPVDVIQSLFAALDPFLVTRKFVRFAELSPSSQAAEDFVALEDWLNDGIGLAAPVARECLGGWYGRNTPQRGIWEIAGHRVRPAEVAIPALALIPQQDRIVPPASAQALADQLPNATAISPRLGHIGMVAGSRARTEAWEPLAAWLAAL
jgi:polyhydroxyalkanoate synthase